MPPTPEKERGQRALEVLAGGEAEEGGLAVGGGGGRYGAPGGIGGVGHALERALNLALKNIRREGEW